MVNVKKKKKNKNKKKKINLFFSRPIRNAASATAARRLPFPASFLHTANSLTKAYIHYIYSRISNYA